MQLFISTGLLIMVAILGLIVHHHLLPQIADNYINMLLGIILALIPLTNNLVSTFHSEIFMGLVVAPLLFFDGLAIRFNKVVRNIRVVISLTVLMALVCALAAGFSVAFLGVSLPLSFILAAISTPTDATASEAVAEGLVIPRQESLYLKLESLFNDSSGIILLNMAILWYVNGYINYQQTITNFIYASVGGVIFGLVFGGIIIIIEQVLIHSKINLLNSAHTSATPPKVLCISTPFILYYASEAIHVSGIIAVVCAGLLLNASAERSSLLNPRINIDMTSLMQMVKEILNGIVFVVLGVMMVRITKNNTELGHPVRWLFIGLTLYLANVIVRYLYSLVRFRMNRKASAIFSFGGVHGAVTFALAFIVAESSVKNDDFNLILMAEAVLIILSLLVPTILFRFILKKEPNNKLVAAKTHMIRQAMVQHAIDKINAIYLPEGLRRRVLYDLRSQMGEISIKDFLKALRKTIRQPALSSEERNTLDMAYRLAFSEERDYLSEVSQQQLAYFHIVSNLYSEILMAEMVVLDY